MSQALYQHSMRIAAKLKTTETKRCPYCGKILKLNMNDEGIGYWDICKCPAAQKEDEDELAIDPDFDHDYPCDQEGYYPPPALRFSASDLSEEPWDQ